ncbi:hypothetical protein NLI96_g8943 [Meripilus lineatus]|uniref:phosphoacetylglucosamine mutase n=1 Tax=Meripilus lineatus TaxID=2056292 RepID=A0AAD5UY41_9APHY|nr:hypothetical protein NLI96_g8943 [Physisporinus lineatus]
MSRSVLSVDTIRILSDRHAKPSYLFFQYGTAGFRTLGVVLDSVMFRVGILAALRSKKLDGKTVGVMVTASHNPEPDNGVKLVDPRGEMLESAWEVHATNVANAQTSDALIEVLQNLVKTLRIDLTKPANVIFARDTRPSGPALIESLQDGLQSVGCVGRNAGVISTPILHYLVRTINAKGTKEDYGVDSVDGYMEKLSSAFLKLVKGKQVSPPLLVDCANGVGAHSLEEITKYLKGSLQLIGVNTATGSTGVLNNACGADYVKTTQRLPPSLAPYLKPGERACSFDGDADRLMYYYLDERGQFHMLDGDKIAALVAAFIVELVKGSGLEGQVRVGIVQTAYANGASTKYLSDRLPVKCVPTGVKHLHHAAESYDIGVYFEANGHGTVLFSRDTTEKLANHQPITPAQSTSLNHLMNLMQVINQTVGDALSDLLLVEVILAHKSYSGIEWDSLYVDLPNRLVKVVVADRFMFKTEDAERRLISPPGLQQKIDELVRRYEAGRAFVRPSGTEDVVRVYAEASVRSQADGEYMLLSPKPFGDLIGPSTLAELAFRVAGLVYDEVGGDPEQRPSEFLRPINGDGFGVGKFTEYVASASLILKVKLLGSTFRMAWNNVNLVRLAEKIKSPLVFAHVRATTAGSLSLDNCHPWQFGRIMFMHNGGVAAFPQIKRKLQSYLSDELFNMVSGNTGMAAIPLPLGSLGLTRHCPVRFRMVLPDPHAAKFTTETLRQAMYETIQALNEMTEEVGATEPSLMNFCVTDGESVIATRYINSRQDEAASLWFSSGTTFSEYAEGGHYRMAKRDKRENIIMIASEPLTFEKADWMEIRTNHMAVITPKMNFLQIPIKDKYFIDPSDPASSVRGTSFAAAKGLLSPATRRETLSTPLETAEKLPLLVI